MDFVRLLVLLKPQRNDSFDLILSKQIQGKYKNMKYQDGEVVAGDEGAAKKTS